jgi:hypothetical protein
MSREGKMRFLEEHELPEWERERRKPIVDLIDHYQQEIAKHFAHAEPILRRMVQAGEYGAEQAYRERLYRETELIRREIIQLKQHLPPFMMCREDEILERIPAVRD